MLGDEEFWSPHATAILVQQVPGSTGKLFVFTAAFLDLMDGQLHLCPRGERALLRFLSGILHHRESSSGHVWVVFPSAILGDVAQRPYHCVQTCGRQGVLLRLRLRLLRLRMWRLLLRLWLQCEEVEAAPEGDGCARLVDHHAPVLGSGAAQPVVAIARRVEERARASLRGEEQPVARAVLAVDVLQHRTAFRLVPAGVLPCVGALQCAEVLLSRGGPRPPTPAGPGPARFPHTGLPGRSGKSCAASCFSTSTAAGARKLRRWCSASRARRATGAAMASRGGESDLERSRMAVAHGYRYRAST